MIRLPQLEFLADDFGRRQLFLNVSSKCLERPTFPQRSGRDVS